jgi:hypothetical protein
MKEMEGAMSSLALLGLVTAIGLLNLITGLLQWLVSGYGLMTATVMLNIILCVFTPFCPPASIMRRLCASAGCVFE